MLHNNLFFHESKLKENSIEFSLTQPIQFFLTNKKQKYQCSCYNLETLRDKYYGLLHISGWDPFESG